MAKNRELLMLAKVFNPKKHSIGGWYCSEKLDGFRVFWDGGLTTGLQCSDVPWYNSERDSRSHVSTGLWTRYGKPVFAPKSFIEQLPNYFLDGEFYLGRGKFQELRSICSKLPENRVDREWEKVNYIVFDSPRVTDFCLSGKINNPNFSCQVSCEIWTNFINSRASIVPNFKVPSFSGFFDICYEGLKRYFRETNNVKLLEQVRLPMQTQLANEFLEKELDKVVGIGGEGLMLRHPQFSWEPVRYEYLLKYKPFEDSEAFVMGYKWGEKTDKGSKLLGKMGSLRVRWINPFGKVKEFDLSGFTDDERILIGMDSDNRNLSDSEILKLGEQFAGQIVNGNRVFNPRFPVNSKVTFRYRKDLTDDGFPKEARFWRTA